jgi:hypothetical protein
MKLTDYHGPVRKCEMCLPAINIHKQFCQWCMSRGYLATCLACDGKGKTRVPVQGSIGEMDSTCTLCGGKGTFPASKAAYDLTHPDEPVEEKHGVEMFPEVTNSEKQRLITA